LGIPGISLNSSRHLSASRERTGERPLLTGPAKCKVVLTRGQVMYKSKLLGVLGLELRNLSLKSAFQLLGTVGKCIVKVCATQRRISYYAFTVYAAPAPSDGISSVQSGTPEWMCSDCIRAESFSVRLYKTWLVGHFSILSITTSQSRALESQLRQNFFYSCCLL